MPQGPKTRMEDAHVIVSKLRLRVIENGQPQYMIAAKAGMSPSQLSRYILGQNTMRPIHLMNLCEVLKCEPSDITGDEFVDMRD